MNSEVPERTCLACRRRRPKPELIRIVRTPAGLPEVDPQGRADGRGAYVCRDDPGCRRAAARRGALSRALRVTLGPDDLARLNAEIEKETSQV
jgi:predicted RNA-binding protein YlxR (DUF448 family)